MDHVVVDTDVVSYVYRGGPIAEPFRPILEGATPYISFMTYAELRFGALNRSWGSRRTGELLSFVTNTFVLVQSSREIAEAWARLQDAAKRQGRVLRFADGWIGATAVATEMPLVTNNLKDFDYLPEIKLLHSS